MLAEGIPPPPAMLPTDGDADTMAVVEVEDIAAVVLTNNILVEAESELVKCPLVLTDRGRGTDDRQLPLVWRLTTALPFLAFFLVGSLGAVVSKGGTSLGAGLLCTSLASAVDIGPGSGITTEPM